jgi:mRNA interferase MazF
VTRGDLYIAAMQGDYGKPRPVLIIQSDNTTSLDSRIVCPLTTFDEPVAFLRPSIEPAPDNGLQQLSYVMIEKVLTVPMHRFRDRIGQVDAEMMATIGVRLSILLGLA